MIKPPVLRGGRPWWMGGAMLLLLLGDNLTHGFTPTLPLTRHHGRVVVPVSHPEHGGVPRTCMFSSAAMILQDDGDPVASRDQLDALVPRRFITPLVNSKSDRKGLQQVAWHGGLLVASAVLIPVPWLSLLAMAFVSSFFFAGLHECVHRTAFRSAIWNDIWAHVFGVLCLRPAAHYRYYHWQHHKYTGNKDLDAELLPGSFLDFPVDTLVRYFIYLSGIPFWIDAVTTTVRHACGKCPEIYLATEKARRHVTQEARGYLALYVGLAGLGLALPALGRFCMRFWVLPALLGQPFLRFYLFAEHRGRANTPVITENTRTMDTNWLYRKLAWNMIFHQEHHAWPSVPFHKLPQMHELLVNATATTTFTTSSSANNQTEERSVLEPGEQIASGNQGYLHFHGKFLQSLLQKESAMRKMKP
eukprot:scaffold6615_cov172-Amphora_coffeaeformis.AAC.8